MKNKHINRKYLGWLFLVVSLMMFSYPMMRNQVNRWYLQYEIFCQEKQAISKNWTRQDKKAKQINQQLAVRPTALQDFLSMTTYQEEIVYGTKYGKLISIGSVMIPSIDVLLPIYEGTNDTVLSLGAGHVRYSSYPIGGKSTHTVIAAHSGLVSGDYFLKLPKVKKKDYFFIKNKQEILAYQVFKIKQVKPKEIKEIKIVTNEDLATLLTCVPIGVNSDRLVVTGKRVPLSEVKMQIDHMQSKHRLLRKLADTSVKVSRQSIMLVVTILWIMIGMMLYFIGYCYLKKLKFCKR